MPRQLISLALIGSAVLLASAAPVPKSLKKVPPQILGTKWVEVEPDDGQPPITYSFEAAGKFVATRKGDPYSTGTWEQVGGTVKWDYGHVGSKWTATAEADQIEATGRYHNGVTRTQLLRPVR